MSTAESQFTLRVMQPADSAAVASLVTEFDGDLTTRFLLDAYTAITLGTEYRTLGVVVERAGHDGLVGMGTLRFSHVYYNGERLPLVFLDGLKVHPDFRRQGLGYQLAHWRVQQARAAYGDQCVIATGMLQDNHASYAVAKKWCREFIEPAIEVLILPARRTPPQPLAGLTVREVDAHEYEAFAALHNRYYQHYNLYPPATAESMARARAVSAEGRQPYRFYAAVDARGNLVAGAQTWARGLLKSDTVNNPPAPLRLMNRFLRLFPADFVIQDVAVTGLWYAPDQVPAARFFWESLRWASRDQGNVLAVGFDPRDRARELVQLRPWHQPRPKITLAVHGPAPINRGQPVYGFGRV